MKTILITGASSGIGQALALAFAGPESMLVLWGRNQERLDHTAAACRKLGSNTQTAAFDLSDTDQLLDNLEQADAGLSIDLAIFNAGIGGSISPERTAQESRAAYQMASVNFTAPVIAANVLAEHMAERSRGQIVFLGSIASSYPLPMAPLYSGSKAGLARFAEAFRLRVSRHGIAVTLVEPGFIDTPMSRQLKEPRPFLISAEKAAKIIKRGILRGQRHIIVPWQFAVIRILTAIIPRVIIRAVLAAVLRKSSAG